MNAQKFLDNFGYIANAPNGVSSLRQLVMASALIGKFSLPNDELPEDIDSIPEENRRDYLESLDKREKPLLFGAPLLQHFELPTGWTWVRVGQICDLQTGATPSRRRPEYFGGDIRWLVSGDINLGEISGCEGRITKEGLENSNCKVIPKNSVMIALNGQGKTRATVALLRVPAACNQSLVAMIPYSSKVISPEYLFLALKYRYYEIRDITGQKQRRGLNMNLVSELSVPLAPIAEQKRIVAKVDELMALCDKLEALQQKCEKIGELARTAALGALSGARPRELQVAWMRVQDNIQLLFGGEKALQDFQDTMVQLAIRGLLSPEYERPVETEKIRNSAAKLRSEYQSKNISRKQKSVPLAQVSEWQYPKHWAVESLDNIAVVIGGVTKGRNLKDRNIESFPYLRVANVQRGFFDLSEMKEISIPIEEFEKYKILEEDLLITEGGDWDKVGRTAIWKSQIPNCIHQNHVFKVRIPSDQLLNEWVALVLNSEVGKQYFASASKQTTNLASINMTQLRSFPLPIPHIVEQKAILQKVNSLVILYQKATAQSIQEANLASDLAAAIVGRVTGTQFKEQEKMKAPKMELVSALKVGASPKLKDQAPLTSLLTKNKGELSAKALWSHSGLKIDEFYQQLKTEMTNGWIIEPEKAVMREVTAD